MRLDGLSLAQYVARLGGLRHVEGHDNGEMATVQEVNKHLKGKNSIVRPSGTPADEILADVNGAGYSVTPDTFLELLTDDAWALIQGRDAHRVFAEYDDLEDWSAWELDSVGTCSVCGGVDVTGNPDNPLCDICFDWSLAIANPLEFEQITCASVPVLELTWEYQEIMIEAIERWIA